MLHCLLCSFWKVWCTCKACLSHISIWNQTTLWSNGIPSQRWTSPSSISTFLFFANTELTISKSSGTIGWCAPEVLAWKPYNPLLADQWSCSCILTFFTECMKPGLLQEKMYSLSQRLMNPDPSLQPSVSNWYPQKMGGTLNPLIQPIALDLNGAPEPRSSRRLKGSRCSSSGGLVLMQRRRRRWSICANLYSLAPVLSLNVLCDRQKFWHLNCS